MALPKFPLTVELVGEGEVTSAPLGIECGVTCTAEFAETSKVTLTATPKPGWRFAGWSGGCSGTGTCEVTISEASEVTAEFAESLTAPLTVAKTGKGTVASAPSGIDLRWCVLGGIRNWSSVTLTETPEAGYEFAGWIGCKSTGETTCEVEVTQAAEVTAIFLKAAEQGEPGPKGEKGEAGPKGEKGEAGAKGESGAKGEKGPAGVEGGAGAVGKDGAQGPAGPAGPQGPAGPAGAQGPAGSPGKVELGDVQDDQKKGRKAQQCTTKLVSGTVKFTTAGASAHATLSRRGTVFAAGTARSERGKMSLRLAPLRTLRPGRYTLTLISGAGRHRTIRSESFTLR